MSKSSLHECTWTERGKWAEWAYFSCGDVARAAWSRGAAASVTPCRITTSTSCDRAQRAAASRARAALRNPSASTEGKQQTHARGAVCVRSTARSRLYDALSPRRPSPGHRYHARNSPRSPLWGSLCGTSRRCRQPCGTLVLKQTDLGRSAGRRRCARTCPSSPRNWNRRLRRSSRRTRCRPSIRSSRSSTATTSTGHSRDSVVSDVTVGQFQIRYYLILLFAILLIINYIILFCMRFIFEIYLLLLINFNCYRYYLMRFVFNFNIICWFQVESITADKALTYINFPIRLWYLLTVKFSLWMLIIRTIIKILDLVC